MRLFTPIEDRDLIHHYQESLRKYAIILIRQQGHNDIANFLEEKSKIENITSINKRLNEWDKLREKLKTNKILTDFIEFDARINYLCRSIRKFLTMKAINVRDKKERQTAEHIEYSIKKWIAQGVSVKKLQEHFNQNGIAWFSLTAHPTNPSSVNSTKKLADFDKQLQNGNPETLENSIKAFLNEPLIDIKKKTPDEELDETLIALKNIYESHKAAYQHFENVLTPHGIRVENPLIKPCIWTLGDGDGNPNQNEKNLSEGIQTLKSNIREKYRQDINELMKQCPTDTKKALSAIKEKIDNYTDSEELIADLNTLYEKKFIEESAQKSLMTLMQQVKTFQFRYAAIDLRHNSADIMSSLSKIIEKIYPEEVDFALSDIEKIYKALPQSKKAECQLVVKKLEESQYNKEEDLINDLQSLNGHNDESDRRIAKLIKLIQKQGLTFTDQSTQHQIDKITEWLQQEDSLKKLNAITQSNTFDRITERFKVVANHPEMFEKIIIAENKGTNSLLASLLLLKISGGNPDTIDFVPLVESLPDLKKVHLTMKSLFEMPIYLSHLKKRKKFIAQIAKSDTVRRHGRGVEFNQEETIKELFETFIEMQEKNELLNDVKLSIYHGAGAALQRGGGKPTESSAKVANIVRKVCQQKEIKNFFGMGPTTLTVQGHDQCLLFSPESRSQTTIEALISQGFHASLRTAYPDVQFRSKDNDQYDKERKVISEAMLKSFHNLIQNQAFNQLFENACWNGTKLGNSSSRPSKRGDGQSGDAETVKELKGNSPKIQEQRAIGAERLGAHSRTFILAILGLLDGLESQENLHDIYLSSKSERDSQRNTAILLHMLDFNIAWKMMIGEDHPDSDSITTLAEEFEQQYLNRGIQGCIDGHSQFDKNRRTLAWLEQYTLKIARLNYKAITGHPAPENLNTQTPLEKNWPDVANQLTSRSKQLEFAHFCEAYLTHTFNQAENQGQEIRLTEELKREIKVTYAASDLSNTPIGSLMTLTSALKPGDAPINELNSEAIKLDNLEAAMSQHAHESEQTPTLI